MFKIQSKEIYRMIRAKHIILFIISCIFLSACIVLFDYKSEQKQGRALLNQVFTPNGEILSEGETYYDINHTHVNYQKLYQLILPKVLTNSAIDYNGNKINKEDFIFLPQNYIVPDLIMKESDIMISYGVLDDVSPEKFYTQKYKKPAYSFDCGIKNITLPNSLCHFSSECVGNDFFVLTDELGQISSQKIHIFSQKIKTEPFKNKKIFLKMDIAAGEPFVIPDIIKCSDRITGITLTWHLDSENQIINAIKVIDKMDKDFVLVARANLWLSETTGQTCKYAKGDISPILVCTYINKNLLKKWSLDWNQSGIKLEGKILKQFNDIMFKDKKLNKYNTYEKLAAIPDFTISKMIVSIEKLKEINKKLKKNYI